MSAQKGRPLTPEAGVGDSGFGVRKSGLTDSGSEIDPNSEPRSPNTDVVAGMGKSRKSAHWRPQIFKINPTKLLKTQVRCPESDKTIPISDRSDQRPVSPVRMGKKGKWPATLFPPLPVSPFPLDFGARVFEQWKRG